METAEFYFEYRDIEDTVRYGSYLSLVMLSHEDDLDKITSEDELERQNGMKISDGLLQTNRLLNRNLNI